MICTRRADRNWSGLWPELGRGEVGGASRLLGARRVAAEPRVVGQDGVRRAAPSAERVQSATTVSLRLPRLRQNSGATGTHPYATCGAVIEEFRFAPDSPLEGNGFEPSVPVKGTALFRDCPQEERTGI